MKRVQGIMLVMGVAGLCIMVHSLGMASIGAGMQKIGLAFILVVGTHAGLLARDAVTMRSCSGMRGVKPGFLALLQTCMCGHAINVVTPGGQLGELTKYGLLRRHMSREGAIATLVATNTLMTCGSLVMLALAAGLALAALDLPGIARVMMGGMVLGSTLLAVLLLALLRWSNLGWVYPVLRRVPIPRSRRRQLLVWIRSWLRQASRTRENPIDWMWALLSCVVSPLCGVAETALILSCLGWDDAVMWALLARANSQLVAQLTSIIPLQAGSAESGAFVLFMALGQDPHAGVVVELVRKMRAVVFVVAGTAWLAWERLGGGNKGLRVTEHGSGSLPHDPCGPLLAPVTNVDP